MASTTAVLRKDLSSDGLIRIAREQFEKIEDHRRGTSVRHSLPDTLCAALAMFQFKFPSMLQFDKSMNEEGNTIASNLKRLYSLESVASDSQMRQILDPVAPSELRRAFRAVHSRAQRGKVLEDFSVLDNRLLLSIDGTGLFSSSKVSCPHCGVKKTSAGEVSYYHQLLAAAIVHPGQQCVLPLDFEPIVRADGDTKNDCERNAAKRLLQSIKRQYPKRRFIILEDALAANGPHSQALIDHRMDFIINIKSGGNASLFVEMHQRMLSGDAIEHEHLEKDGSGFGYRFASDLALNDSHREIRVNRLEYWVIDKKGQCKNFSWITSLPITRSNATDMAKMARTRWKIENELFNTLKNPGYDLGHNFGHGQQNLSSTLAGLTLLAFLFDQLQGHACALFKAARQRKRILKNLWSSMRFLIENIDLPGWETFWRLQIKPSEGGVKLMFIDSG